MHTSPAAPPGLRAPLASHKEPPCPTLVTMAQSQPASRDAFHQKTVPGATPPLSPSSLDGAGERSLSWAAQETRTETTVSNVQRNFVHDNLVPRMGDEGQDPSPGFPDPSCDHPPRKPPRKVPRRGLWPTPRGTFRESPSQTSPPLGGTKPGAPEAARCACPVGGWPGGPPPGTTSLGPLAGTHYVPFNCQLSSRPEMVTQERGETHAGYTD